MPSTGTFADFEQVGIVPLLDDMNEEPEIDVEFALWGTLMCRCETCGAMLDLTNYDSLLDRDPIEWSKTVAPIVESHGWVARSEFALLCPSCANP